MGSLNVSAGERTRRIFNFRNDSTGVRAQRRGSDRPTTIRPDETEITVEAQEQNNSLSLSRKNVPV